MVERVLVIPRKTVPGGCDFLGVRPAGEGDIAELHAVIAGSGQWVDRPAAEDDPSLKQVIPYVVVRDGSGEDERVFFMERTAAGGDARLHRRATIGVGGHLNPVDGESLADGEPLTAGLFREWREELDTDWSPAFSPVGLLNDDRNAVGAVHLGVVFAVQAMGRALAVREHDKLSGRMAPVAELAAAWERLETWSQLVAEALWDRPGG